MSDAPKYESVVQLVAAPRGADGEARYRVKIVADRSFTLAEVEKLAGSIILLHDAVVKTPLREPRTPDMELEVLTLLPNLLQRISEAGSS